MMGVPVDSCQGRRANQGEDGQVMRTTGQGMRVGGWRVRFGMLVEGVMLGRGAPWLEEWFNSVAGEGLGGLVDFVAVRCVEFLG